MTDHDAKGLARGLTNYGDPDFAIYLRISFAKSTWHSAAMIDAFTVGGTGGTEHGRS